MIESDNTEINNLVKLNVQQFDQQSRHRNLITFCYNFRANHIEENQTNNYLVTVETTINTFRNLKNKTSAGLDNIPQTILKHLPDRVILQYTTIFNNALNNNYFPKTWKVAKVIAIRKPKKDPTEPDNYRPISLMPDISKIFEKIIMKSILHYTLWR